MRVNLGWLDRNSQRDYPLDDTASGVDDAGIFMPSDFLVECRIWVPNITLDSGGRIRYVYVSSAAISESFVSLTLLGSAYPLVAANAGTVAYAENFVPLASITVPQTVTPFRNYAVEPLYDGVKGWVAFGEAILSKRFASLFSTPQQSMLLPRAVSFFASAPVTSFAAKDGFNTIEGDVKFSVTEPLQAEILSMTLDGESTARDMIVLSLEETEEALKQYSGPCGKRSESGTCGKQPITTIAGVSPDCTGDITVTFTDLTVRNFNNPEYPGVGEPVLRGGLCLDADYELDDICSQTIALPDSDGNLPLGYDWERPCDLTTPFSPDFSSTDAFLTTMIPAIGYFFIDSNVMNGANGSGTAEIFPCLRSIDSGLISRTVVVTFTDVAEDDELGLILFDNLSTRVLFTSISGDGWELKKINKTTDVETVLDSGSSCVGTSMSAVINADRTINVLINECTAATYEFASDDTYFDSNGRVGISIIGTVGKVTAYTVTDV